MKEFFLKIYVYIFVDHFIIYKYLYINKDKDYSLHNYIEKKARELAESENIKILSISYDELNKDKDEDNEKAVGIFRYIKNGVSRQEYDKLILDISKYREIDNSEILPRIEITEKADVFTILHELGHYFIYKRDQVQSEHSANLFIDEFFNNYLPPFFKWIFQIDVHVRTKIKIRNYSKFECYKYIRDYKKWKKDGIQ